MKRLIIFFLSLLAIMTLKAKDVLSLLTSVIPNTEDSPVTVTYKQPEGMGINGILDVMNIDQMTANIIAEKSEAMFYEIWLVHKTNDVEHRKLFGFLPIKNDSTSICVTVQNIDSTQVRVSIYPRMSLNHTINMPTANCILMECIQSSSDTIPILGYTPGLHKRVKISEDQFADTYDYCAVRNANKHPSLWGKEFGIDDYFYIEAIPVKEIDYQKAMLH